MNRSIAFVLVALSFVSATVARGQVIRNGGFDTDLSAWTISANARDLVTYSTIDANGSRASGSARIASTCSASFCVGGQLWQPFSLGPLAVNKYVRVSAKAFIDSNQIGTVYARIAALDGMMWTTTKGAWTPIEFVVQLPSDASGGDIRGGVTLSTTAALDDEPMNSSPIAYFDDVRIDFVAPEALCPSDCSVTLPPTIMQGEAAEFTGRASSSCGESPLMHIWWFGENSRALALVPAEKSMTYTYETGGRYEWSFLAVGRDTLPCARSGQIAVGWKGCAPATFENFDVQWSGAASHCASGSTCLVGETITFSVVKPVEDSSCAAPAIEWKFSDGMTASGLTVARQFSEPGSYAVKTTISRGGSSSSSSRGINIGTVDFHRHRVAPK